MKEKDSEIGNGLFWWPESRRPALVFLPDNNLFGPKTAGNFISHGSGMPQPRGQAVDLDGEMKSGGGGIFKGR